MSDTETLSMDYIDLLNFFLENCNRRTQQQQQKNEQQQIIFRE